MATTDLSTGSGRRKQAKPQRKNVEVEVGEEAVVTEVCVGVASPPPGAEHLQLSVRLLTPEPATIQIQRHSPYTNSSDTDNVPLGGGGLKDESLGGAGAEEAGLGRAPPAPPPGQPPAGPLACIHCAAPFPTRDQLEKHELLHSPNAQVSCKVCNKTFANVYRLQRHMISHDESAVLRKFKCPECEKAFKFKHHLKEHIRIHSGEKPFECLNCGKRFSHSGSYSSHTTSKKCLVMNIKGSQRQGGGGPTRSGEAKGTPQGGGYRGPASLLKRTTNNSFPPILPKYNEAAAFLAGFPPPPFYLNPTGFVANQPSPYGLSTSLNRLLEQLNPPPPTIESKPTEEESPKTPPPRVKEEPEEEEKCPESSPGVGSNSGDLETVKRILETVNANVTKEFLAANVQKLSSNSCSSGCPSVASGAPSPPPSDEQTDAHETVSLACRFCHKSFASRIDLHQHERYLCTDEKSEGLAAKLEDVISVKQEDTNGNLCSASEDDILDDEAEHDQDGRKVRVRSQIADEQLQILKGYYAVNPRPKREELARIAERVGFPVRVVQVWFQNTRARDRREGRFLHVPYAPTVPPAQALVSSHYLAEQPLDLSTKKSAVPSTSSPECSPHRSDSEDSGAVNLSARKSSPLNDSRLARILTQPHGVMLYANRDHQFVRSPIPAIAVHNGSFSPTSEKRSWRQGLMEFPDYTDEAEDSAQGSESMIVSTMDSPPHPSFVLPLGLTNHQQLKHQLQYAEQPSPIAAKRAKLTTTDSLEPDGQFNCDECDKTFAKHSSLTRHKYEHSGQRPHICDICTKAFKHKHHLTEHKRLHSGEKPFQCLKCLKRFSHSGSFSQHMNHRFSYCKPYRE